VAAGWLPEGEEVEEHAQDRDSEEPGEQTLSVRPEMAEGPRIWAEGYPPMLLSGAGEEAGVQVLNQTLLAVAPGGLAQQYERIFRHPRWAGERGTSVEVVTVPGAAELALGAALEGVERLPVELSERAGAEEEPRVGHLHCYLYFEG
jgi:hypothetical protein